MKSLSFLLAASLLWGLAPLLPAASRTEAPVTHDVETRWAAQLGSFFDSPAPDYELVRDAVDSIDRMDLDVPSERERLAAVSLRLRSAAKVLLDSPVDRSATEAQLWAASNKFRLLNTPALRELLAADQQPRVAAAAWAFNRQLWRKETGLASKIEGIRKALERSGAGLDSGSTPELSPLSNRDVRLQVVKGDVFGCGSQAVIATIDPEGLCDGGINAFIDRSGGEPLRRRIEAAMPLSDGSVLHLAGVEASPAGKTSRAVLVTDALGLPLHELVYRALRAADQAGLSSVALPVIRTGFNFGAVEKTYEEIVSGTALGVHRFLTEGAAGLKEITFVVARNHRLFSSLHAALSPMTQAERERSLRTDMRRAVLSGRGYSLKPRKIDVPRRDSPIYRTMSDPWDLSKLMEPHFPVRVGTIRDRAAFSRPVVSVLNMPVKMPGTGYRFLEEHAQFREFFQQVIDHEAAVNPDIKDFYAYLTVDQFWVPQGTTQRRPGIHIDGVQGARYKVKLPPEHLYSASDSLGTVFYDQVFDLRHLDPARHHVHAELERQAKEENAVAMADYGVFFWDSYSAHRADVAPEDMFRTFVRVEFSRKKYDSVGDTRSPLFDYDWKPVSRPIPADLDDRPVERPRPTLRYSSKIDPAKDPGGHLRFGLEMEYIPKAVGPLLEIYGPDPSFGIEPEAWFARSIESRLRWYRKNLRRLFPTYREPGGLIRLKESEGSRRLLERPILEASDNLEIKLGPFDTYEEWEEALDGATERFGRGALQAMVSTPKEAAFSEGKASADELFGFLKFYQDYDVLAELDRGAAALRARPWAKAAKSFDHPHTGPPIKLKDDVLKLFLDSHAEGKRWKPANLDWIALGLHSFKMSGATVYRPDVAWPRRIAFEVRDCHRDPECLKERVKRIVHSQEKGLSPFARTAELKSFDSVAAYDRLSGPARRMLERLTSYPIDYSEVLDEKDRLAGESFRNFAWPMRDWSEHVRLFADLDPRLAERIESAQQAYQGNLASIAARLSSRKITKSRAFFEVQRALVRFAEQTRLYPAFVDWERSVS